MVSGSKGETKKVIIGIFLWHLETTNNAPLYSIKDSQLDFNMDRVLYYWKLSNKHNSKKSSFLSSSLLLILLDIENDSIVNNVF